MGKKMVGLAREYRKAHPSAKWSTCMKEAGKEYRKLKGSKK